MFRIDRRKVLQTLGAGAAIPLASQSAGADQRAQTSDEGESDQEGCPPCIDPVFGYSASQAGSLPDTFTPSTTVALKGAGGAGVHPGFPSEPDPEAPGQFIEIPAEFFFDPVGLHVTPGEVVVFENVSMIHTVTAFHEKFSDEYLPIPQRVPEDVPGFTSPPIVNGEAWVYQFTTPGVYDIFCFPHLGLGMVMRIVVMSDDAGEVPAAPTAGPLFPNVEVVLNAPELDPASIVDSGSVAWSDLTLPQC